MVQTMVITTRKTVAIVTGPPTLCEVLDWLEWKVLRLKAAWGGGGGVSEGTVVAERGHTVPTLLLQASSLLGAGVV